MPELMKTATVAKADAAIVDSASDVSVAFARSQERAMASSVTARARRELAPMLNEFSAFTRAATFGDVSDLYFHAPTNRIGANYTPSAARVLERPVKPATKKPDKKRIRTNEEILRETPRAPYPSMAHPPRTVRGVPIDIAARTPVEPLKEGFVRGGHAVRYPFDELDVVVGDGTGTGDGDGEASGSRERSRVIQR